MKKAVLFLTILACVFRLTGCSGKSEDADIPDLSTVRVLVAEQRDAEEDCLEKLAGQPRDAMIQAWGQPDGSLFGFFGDIWKLGAEGYPVIILYYDQDGFVKEVRIAEEKE